MMTMMMIGPKREVLRVLDSDSWGSDPLLFFEKPYARQKKGPQTKSLAIDSIVLRASNKTMDNETNEVLEVSSSN